jgi:hypothetical protein
MVHGAGRNTLQSCLELAIDNGNRESCAILFEAGMKTAVTMNYAVKKDDQPSCEWLVRQYQVDPFVVQDQEEDGAVSLFHASAHKENIAIFEYFLGLWDARDKQGHGIDFQVIELLVKQHVSGHKENLAIFEYFLGMWNARDQHEQSVDVLDFFLS